MDLELADRTVLIAGASQGIGRAAALALAAEGAVVVLCSRDERRLQAVHDDVTTLGGTAMMIAGDLRLPAVREHAVQLAFERTGYLHGVVNTVGGAERGDPLEAPIDSFVAALTDKFIVQFDLARTATRRMAGQPEGGVIINLAGVGGVEPFPTHLAGGAANAALLLTTKGLARHAAALGVRILALSPGLVATDSRRAVMTSDAARAEVEHETIHRELTAGIPLGRMATAEEVAAVITFLLSRRSAFFTGCHIVLDGGQTHGI